MTDDGQQYKCEYTNNAATVRLLGCDHSGQVINKGAMGKFVGTGGANVYIKCEDNGKGGVKGTPVSGTEIFYQNFNLKAPTVYVFISALSFYENFA